MLSLSKPSPGSCREFIERSHCADLSYAYRGCVARGDTPAGFSRDHARCLLGKGESSWWAAVESFKQWEFMPASVVEVVPPASIQCDQIVGVLFRGLGVWSLNPARIIEVHESADETARVFGFTYGTVAGHVEQGEERFLLKWDLESDEVWYLLDAVSRPKHFLAWVAYPYARYQQARFRRESCQSMLKSVEALHARPLEMV